MADVSIVATTLTVAFVTAFLYSNNATSQYKRVLAVLDGLKLVEQENRLKGTPKVACGFEANVDYFVDSLDLFKAMNLKPPKEAKAHNILTSEKEFLETFAFFFQHSAASSRYMKDKELFRKMVVKALTLKGTRKLVGGSGLQIGKRLVKEGCHVLAAADSSAELINMLPENMSAIGHNTDVGDIHLLLEYPAHLLWGTFVSQRANRLVIHSDVNNPCLKSLDKFQENVQQFSPSVLVVSGLHKLHNGFQGFTMRESDGIFKRLTSLLDTVRVPVHYEMSSFHHETLFDEMLRHVIPYVSSMGMNEQELPNLWSKLIYGNITMVSSQKPRVATVLDLMRDLYRVLRGNYIKGNKIRELTRIHVHTLAFQAILTTKGSNWKNTKAAVAKASLTATRHVCGSEEIDPKKSKLLMDDSFSKSAVPGSPRVQFNPSSPVSCWEKHDYEICVAPVLVCTQVLQTGGGGDHITAGGLVLQI